VIELKRKMWILLEFVTKNVFFKILTIKLNSWLTEPFKLNVILSKDNKISDMSCYILVQSCDWTESENVNCLKISDENDFL
jgi:hypothetical protein